MARMLCIQLTLLSLISCASIRPLSHEEQPEVAQVKNKSLSIAEIREAHDIKNTVDLDDLEEKIKETKKTVVVEEKVLIEAEKEIIKKYEKKELLKEDPVSSEAVGEAEFDITYKKKHYDFWIKYFTKRDRKRFLRHSKNGTKYKELVETIFEEEGLPKDLFFVGLIESGYNSHIRSSADAVGPWQFIKGTATRYGLRVDSRVDERRNIFKATRAAAHYFKDLYNIFGSWELAMCAYNAGEYRIINAIRRGNTRDYKSLVAKKLLPKETIYYIPKVAAAKELWKLNRVSKHSDHKIFNNVSEVKLYKSFSAKRVRKTLGMNYKLFKKLNPDMKKDWVSKRRKGHRLYIPNNMMAGAKTKLAALKAKRRPARISRAAERISGIHKVRRGESLYKIARKYGTTIRKIKARNALRRNKIFVGQKLKVLKKATMKKKLYTVKSGDSLYKIARKHGTTVRKIKARNSLQKSKILVGQKLKILKKAVLKKKLYIVKRGDSLYRIARKFGLTVNSIVSANSLSNKTIYPSQKIYLPRLL